MECIETSLVGLKLVKLSIYIKKATSRADAVMSIAKCLASQNDLAYMYR